MIDDTGECGCGKCCLPTIIQERDEAMAEATKMRAENAAAVARVGLSIVCGPKELAEAVIAAKKERDAANKWADESGGRETDDLRVERDMLRDQIKAQIAESSRLRDDRDAAQLTLYRIGKVLNAWRYGEEPEGAPSRKRTLDAIDTILRGET